MAWIQEKYFNHYRNYVNSAWRNKKNVLEHNIFTDITPYIGERFYKVYINQQAFLLKKRENSEKDDIKHEYKVGLLLNNLRDIIPNFVSTIAYFKTNDSSKHVLPCAKKPTKHDVNKYILVEMIDGSHVSQQLKLSIQFKLLMQIAFALHIAQEKYKFVHYNLHRGNVIIRKLGKNVLIKYDNYYLETDVIAVIIDFGRSYTNETKGHEYMKKRVLNDYNEFHDIFNYIYSVFEVSHTQIMNELFEFYGYKKWKSHKSFSVLLDDVVIKGDNIVKRHPIELAKFLYNKYNFKCIVPSGTVGDVSSTDLIYRPRETR